MDQCHIHICHRAVAWTLDVTYVCAIRLRGLNIKNPVFRIVATSTKLSPNG